MIKKATRALIDSQKYISRKFDLLLPEQMTVFANDIFDSQTFPKYLKPQSTIYDIGGGKHPNISKKQKTELNLTVVGFDIDQKELDQSPEGIYDEAVAADITKYKGHTNGDVIICRALLEHVPDVTSSLHNIAHMTKGGGHILIFGPCKNALFTRINMILPDSFKKKLLHFMFPRQQKRIGFKAYYDRCTPKEFEKIAQDAGLEVKEKYVSYNSQYFSVLAPFHILWRLYQLIPYSLKADNLCEAYVLVLKKPD